MTPAAEFRVLVFSKTTGFRHDSIDEGIAAIQPLGEENDFQVDATEDATVFRGGPPDHYDTVVFLSTTGDPLNDTPAGGVRGLHPGRRRLHRHPRRGRHRVRLGWYGGLVGGYFRNHPAGTPSATVNIEDTDHPSTTGITTPWPRVDEWYNYQSPVNPSPGGGGTDYSPRANPNIHVLATVDEATYAEDDGVGRRRRRPPDLVVPALRRRPLVVHGHGPHRGVVLRGAVPAAPPRRPPGLGGRGG